jgi:hypothetical protein
MEERDNTPFAYKKVEDATKSNYSQTKFVRVI